MGKEIRLSEFVVAREVHPDEIRRGEMFLVGPRPPTRSLEPELVKTLRLREVVERLSKYIQFGFVIEPGCRLSAKNGMCSYILDIAHRRWVHFWAKGYLDYPGSLRSAKTYLIDLTKLPPSCDRCRLNYTDNEQCEHPRTLSGTRKRSEMIFTWKRVINEAWQAIAEKLNKDAEDSKRLALFNLEKYRRSLKSRK